MADNKALETRERRCREMASRARNPELKWLYEDNALHYRTLIERGAYDADVRVEPRRQDD